LYRRERIDVALPPQIALEALVREAYDCKRVTLTGLVAYSLCFFYNLENLRDVNTFSRFDCDKEHGVVL